MQSQAQAVAGKGTLAAFPMYGVDACANPADFLPARAARAPAADPFRIDPKELEQHRLTLTKFATWMLRNPTAAEDAVQDTLLAALQSPERFAGRSSVKTWLFGILKHKVADIFRQQAREQPLDDDDNDTGTLEDPSVLFTENGEWRESPSHWANPEEALTQRRFFEVLQRCIETLPKNAAQVFTMREILGMETGEICKALDITANNCFVILHRARMTLRTRLERDWFNGEATSRV